MKPAKFRLEYIFTWLTLRYKVCCHRKFDTPVRLAAVTF